MKKNFNSKIKAFFIFIIIFAITLVIIGAVSEDINYFANIVNGFLSSSLIMLLSYVALKLPFIILIKLVFINSYFSLLSWKYLKQTRLFQDLFLFKRQEVYYIQKRNIGYDLKKLIPLLNKNVSIENKIKFVINPLSVVISLVNCIKDCLIFVINDIALELLKRKQMFYMSFNKINSGALIKSPLYIRLIKGVILIICELALLPLKFIQPIIDLPFWIVYFMFVVAPDYFDSLLPKTDDLSKHSSNIGDMEKKFFIHNKLDLEQECDPRNTMCYIKGRLENKDNDGDSFFE